MIKSMFSANSMDPDFFDTLRNYFEKGIETDVTAVKAGDTNLPEFQKLLEFAAKNLQRYVNTKATGLLTYCFIKRILKFQILLNPYFNLLPNLAKFFGVVARLYRVIAKLCVVIKWRIRPIIVVAVLWIYCFLNYLKLKHYKDIYPVVSLQGVGQVH